ncbi:MAG: restriction endonuclease subunit S [Candidatus Omnitrophica bacterium CG11_big_fil_rev_8_21_14_0_20_63_9]|nr:MAG: restriction endonuclease subunit S [Candidatus Omnitrophica bacterium CG11_big_fil_rev_8_21_14_0_20_63_9]
MNLCDPDAGIQTGPFGSQLHQKDYVAIGTPIITVEHLGENHILHDGVPRVSDEDRNRLSRYLLRPGDIVFSRVGSVDRRALVRRAEDGWLFSGRCLRVRPNPEKIAASFLSYFFGLPAFKEHIRAIAVGATMPSLNTELLSNVVVPYPRDLDEQRAIAHILSTLDDKIEMNRKMNETLEAIAQALFKSRFTYATKDGLPEGWRVSIIGDEVRVVGGSTPSTAKSDFWEGGTFYWATPKDLSTLMSPVLLNTERQITASGLEEISSGLLPPGTVLLSSRAPIGYLAISEVPVAVNQGFIAMVCDKELPNHYVRLWAKENMEAIRANANGTTFPEISKTNFRPLPVLVPSKPAVHEFLRQVEPLHRRVVSNLKESRTLAALRDTLLPKLISGELRVKDARREVVGAIEGNRLTGTR